MSQLTVIQEQIQETLEQFELLRKVKSHLEEVDGQLEAAYAKVKAYDKQLDKELADIDELESIGVKSLFYKTLGSKEQQLEKERQEYLELSLKYKEYKAEVELMEYERDLLKKKESKFPRVKDKLIMLKKARQSEILSSGDEALREEMEQLLHKLDINVSLRKELSEAIQAGYHAEKMIDHLLNELKNAGDWGKWDMYGDRSANFSKRQAIDRAMRILPKARHSLNIFMRELNDLGENQVAVKLNHIQFEKFTDFFFDNLISDWIVQQRIVSTLNDVNGTKTSLKRILMSLDHEFKIVEKEMIELAKQKERMVLS